jgi:hypothetical protein
MTMTSVMRPSFSKNLFGTWNIANLPSGISAARAWRERRSRAGGRLVAASSTASFLISRADI